MRAGIQEFSGDKLTEVRQARGITSRKALADLMQRAPSTITRWEEGLSFPESAALIEISDILSVPVDFLLTARRKGGAAFFRSFSSALKADRLIQTSRLSWLEDIVAVANHYAYLPSVDVPELVEPQAYKRLRDEDIEQLAGELRAHWLLGSRPILNMVDLMEQNGIVVSSETMETDSLDGISRWAADGRPYVLLSRDKNSYVRRQFDAAHELAHLVLHKGLEEDDFTQNFKLIEDQAHRFAASFLMPADQFSLEVGSLTLWELERLKPRWRVSIKAMIVRLSRLNIVDKDQAVRLYRSYSSRGFSKDEPFDKLWPLDEPSLLSDVLQAIISSGIDKSTLLADMPLLAHDIESLTNLPSGWFAQEVGRVVELRPEQRPPRSGAYGPAEILQLGRSKKDI